MSSNKSERSFNNYIKIKNGGKQINTGRYEETTSRPITHELSNKKMFQRYGNSYIISIPHRKIRFIIGPHWLGVLVTISLICGGTWLNLKMLKRHEEYTESTVYLFKLFMALFFVLTHFFLFLTVTTDPGIVFQTPSCVDNSGESISLDELPYCEICSVYQPDHMKIHHCSDCNYCIENMDHHCPWMVRFECCSSSYGCSLLLKNLFYRTLFRANA